MQKANKGSTSAQTALLKGKGQAVGIVQARFNEEVTDALLQACREQLLELGVAAANITHVQVPGALEIPVALAAMAASKKYQALVAIGCIIRGETYHFELVANESGAGVSRVSLDHRLPIANAILTTENLDQALERQVEKGRDAAFVAVSMANLLKRLK